MTALVDAVQLQEPGSDLVELFELVLDAQTLYFHSGIGTDEETEIRFREKTAPYALQTYTAIPIELKGIEKKTDGASARPTLTVANVLAEFSDATGITNKELIGKRVIRRQTLKKYLVGENPDLSNPPVEFPSEKFIIDRVAGENKLAISFELAAASDLEGIKLPNRIVVGKYCNWEYEGYERGRGACWWKSNGQITIGTSTHAAYFNIDDEPILPASISFPAWSAGTKTRDAFVTHASKKWMCKVEATVAQPPGAAEYYLTNANWQRVRTFTAYNNSTDYEYDSTDYEYVKYTDNKIWRLIKDSTGNTPVEGSPYWIRGDLCGKLLSSCKCRFQWRPAGRVTSAVVTYGHDSYSSVPTVTFSDPPAGGTTAIGTASIGTVGDKDGVVTQISVDTPGTGYYDGVPTITIQNQRPGFAARATAVFENNQNLTTRKDTSKPMPFGGFPGSEKYR